MGSNRNVTGMTENQPLSYSASALRISVTRRGYISAKIESSARTRISSIVKASIPSPFASLLLITFCMILTVSGIGSGSGISGDRFPLCICSSEPRSGSGIPANWSRSGKSPGVNSCSVFSDLVMLSSIRLSGVFGASGISVSEAFSSGFGLL